MIHFVGGYMRSGTSMMMAALEAGGLTAAYNPERQRLNDRFGDEHYEPNPAYYELSRAEYRRPDFREAYDGMVVKALQMGSVRLAQPGDALVLMDRDFEEIAQSYDAFFGRPPLITREEHRKLINRIFNEFPGYVLHTPYPAVIESPRPTFSILSQAGWPIDVDKAAAVIRPELYRFQAEKLAPGVAGLMAWTMKDPNVEGTYPL